MGILGPNQPQGDFPPDTYTDALKGRVSDYARKLGQMLLGKGTAQDGTAETQEAYKRYVFETQSQGMPAMSLGEWMQSQQMPR